MIPLSLGCIVFNSAAPIQLKIYNYKIRWCGSMVEQLIRNEQVGGSIPFISSKNRKIRAEALIFFILI